MNKWLFTLFLLALLLVPQVSSANGDNTTKKNQELTTTANVYLNSSNSTLGMVKRWKNIGRQYLNNTNTGRLEEFDEFPKSKYPTIGKWYDKEVSVYAVIQATFSPIRSVSFRADAKVDGRFTSDDSPQTIDEPLTKVDHKFSRRIWIDTLHGEDHKAQGHTTEVLAYAKSQTYTVTESMTVSVYADGQGDAVPGGGGGFSINLNVYQAGGLGFGITNETHPAPGVDRVVKTDRASDSLTINEKDESPTEEYCTCPLTPAFDDGICYAKMDDNNMYTVPKGTYHRFWCSRQNRLSGFPWENPLGWCGSGPWDFDRVERWICYNSACGPRSEASRHAQWWYVGYLY